MNKCCIETSCETCLLLRWTAYGTVGSTGVFASSLAVEDGVPGSRSRVPVFLDFACVSLSDLVGSGESVRTRKVKIMAKGDGAPWKL